MANDRNPAPAPKGARPHIVIVGAGFGGLSAAKALSKADADITLIDRRNHHLFQPLLYQVATAALSPNQIASPIRAIVRRQKNIAVVLDEVVNVDRAARQVIMRDRAIAFDFLVLATGARHAYFGNDHWEKHAPGLKTLEDANAIREKILLAFERAELTPAGQDRNRALSFVIIGGGPTGVELAGAIAELSKRALACDFRHTRCTDPKVILIEAGARLLPSFSPAISDYVKRSLEKRGVEVRLGEAVTECRDRSVMIGETTIEADTIIWAAGVRASRAAEWLGADADRAGRTKVRENLSIDGDPAIFVIGDTANATGVNGKPIPGLAPAAKQQGAYVGRLISARLSGAPAPGPFRYMDFGSLATIGRNSAVVEYGGVKLTGFLAWLFWSAIHIYFLIGFRNRVVVTLDWLWSYVTLERGARLITESVSVHADGAKARPRLLKVAAE
ncbi:MAG: NAD(P)/FAD-dependent oxidoreductase [Parvularculaceae bacterium]|nr:NAD(P)/FAD-dependent oxidoreductase [Parvularculaceae bacterium]